MKAAFAMWRNTRMIILTAVCAAIYGSALLAFKTAIPLIPGITEVRIGNIFPMPLGLMFGPAGAWGAAIGNLIGDIFGGTLSPGSLGGFVGNFLLAYLPYTLWTTFIPFRHKTIDWDPRRPGHWLSYILIAFVSSAACAVIVSTFLDFFGLVPYKVLSKIITANNTLASLIGSLLLTSVFGLVKDHLHLFWVEVLDAEDMGKPIAGALGAWIVAAAAMFGVFGAMTSGLTTGTVSWLSTLFILIGSILL